MQSIGKPREVFHGKTYRILHYDVRHQDGSQQTYEFVEKPAGVLVIAFDKDRFVTLVKEHRIVSKGEQQPWSLPGGVIEGKESAEKAAARELLEETGLAGTLEFFAKRAAAPRVIWDLRCYVAKNVKAKAAPKENLEVKTVSLLEAVHMAVEGEIENDFAALCLIRYAMQNNRVEILEREIDPRLIERGLA